MLKKERLIAIQKTVDEKGIVDVNELIEALDVSDMTIRRDSPDTWRCATS